MNQTIKERMVGIAIIMVALIMVVPSLLGPVPEEPTFEPPVIPEKPARLQSLSLSDQKQQAVVHRGEDQITLAQQVVDERARYALLADVGGEDVIADRGVSSLQDDNIDQLIEKSSTTKGRYSHLGKPLEPLADEDKLANEKVFSEGLKPAWQVQVASFREVANANRLHNQLLEKGFRSYRASTFLEQDQVYRVFVGPELLRSRAEQLAQLIEKSLGVNALVVRYVP